MIMFSFYIARKLLLKCISFLFGYSRKNRRKIFSIKNLSNLLSLTADIRKNCVNQPLNNCVVKKYKEEIRVVKKYKEELCVERVEPVSASSSKKSKIPIRIKNNSGKKPHDVETLAKPSTPNLVMLLQAIGFQLRQFEESKEENGEPKESIKVTIQCGFSQMKAVLEMDGVECQCPSRALAKEGSLWSICGTGPTLDDSISSSKYEESGTNLLPEIPKGINIVVRDVVYRLFKMMNTPKEFETESSTNDLNVSALENTEISETPTLQKTESIDRIFRSRTQPSIQSARVLSKNKEIITTKNLFPTSVNAADEKTAKVANEEVLQRQKTWQLDLDHDSDTTLPNLINSESSSDKKEPSQQNYATAKKGITDYVLSAYKDLDKAVNLLKKSFFDFPPLLQNGTSSVKSSPIGYRPVSACSSSSRSSTLYNSAKSLSVKPPSRRSVPASISKKPVEESTTQLGQITPMRRKSILTILPQKTIPQNRLSVPRTRSNSSLNSLNLSDKTGSNTNRRVSPIRSNTLTPKRNTLGPNTSLRGSSTLPKLKTTSTGTPGTTKFGFSKHTQGVKEK